MNAGIALACESNVRWRAYYFLGSDVASDSAFDTLGRDVVSGAYCEEG